MIWARRRGFVIPFAGREYLMSGLAIAAFLDAYSAVGGAWRELVGCERCKTVCFETRRCECLGHENHAHTLARHVTIARVAGVLAHIRKLEEKSA